MNRLSLPLLALLVACSGSRAVIYVDRQEAIDGAWVVTAKPGGRVRLDVSGDEATLHFHEREIVLRGVGRLRGRLEPDEVYLVRGTVEITVTRTHIRMESRGRQILDRAIGALPPDRRIVIEGYGIRME